MILERNQTSSSTASSLSVFCFFAAGEPGAMLRRFIVDAVTGVDSGVGFLTSLLSELGCLSDRVVDESMVQSC